MPAREAHHYLRPGILVVSAPTTVPPPLAESPGQGSTHHEDAPVAVTVDAPELEIRFGLHGSCSRGAVDEGQLPEASPLTDVGHPFPVHIYLWRIGEKGQWDTWFTIAASSMGGPMTSPSGKERCFVRLFDHFTSTPALEVTLGQCDLLQGASIPAYSEPHLASTLPSKNWSRVEGKTQCVPATS